MPNNQRPGASGADRAPHGAPLSRRDLLALGAGLALAGAVPALAAQPPAQPALPPGHPPMHYPPGPRPTVAMLVYPRMVLLDLVGPLTVLNILGADVGLYWKDRTPVATDVGLPVTPTRTFAEGPPYVDVLFVPGGIMGTVDCMNDRAVTDFLAERGTSAKYVTSVCTGSLALAAAGLLKGYDATSHWAVADLLPMMGARHVARRVVRDRNRITGGGVTAGIDFGLTLAALLKGEEEARRIQLTIEYAPEPPFRNGTPAEAGPTHVAEARARRTWMDAQARAAAERAGARLG